MSMNLVLVRRLMERREELKAARTEIDTELKLIEEMLAGEEAQKTIAELEKEAARPQDHREVVPVSIDDIAPALDFMDLRDLPVWKAVVAILEKVGRPVRAEVMTEAVLLGGRKFGGESPQRSLVAHVSQHKDVVNQESGWIYLVKWGKPKIR